LWLLEKLRSKAIQYIKIMFVALPHLNWWYDELVVLYSTSY